MKKIVIFSIDGILTETNHRYFHSYRTCNCSIKNLSYSHDEPLNFFVYDFYCFFKNRGYDIYIFTQRNEKNRFETVKWLQLNKIEFNKLEMRTINDYRPGYLVKQDFLQSNFHNSYESKIQAVFESDESCIRMYKQNNIKKVYDCKNNLYNSSNVNF